MGLACPSRANEGKVAVRIYRSQGADALQLFQIHDSLAPQQAEIEVFKGFRNLLRQSAHSQNRLNRCLLLLVTEVLKQGGYSVQRVLREALLHGQLGQFSGGKVQFQDTTALVNDTAKGLNHPTSPPC